MGVNRGKLFDQIINRLDLGQEGFELGQAQRAGAVALGLLGIRVRLQEQTGQTQCHAGTGQFGHLAATATLTALKYEVAADKGFDLKLAVRLNGTTKAELEADADNLKPLLGATPGTPKPDQSQGKGAGGGKAAGVGAGRDLYRDTHPSSKTT